LLIFLLLWVIGDWPERWPLLATFSVAMACLVGAAEWVLPGWIRKFIAALEAYRQYTGGVSILQTLFTPAGGMVVTTALLIALTVIGWKLRRAPAGSPAFSLMLALVLSLTTIVIPTWAPYNQLLLLPAVILLLRDWRRLARFGSLTRLLYLLVAGLVIWPWVATLYLSTAWFFRPAPAVQSGWTLPLYTSMLIPFGIMVLLVIDALRHGPGLSPP
jgi:hypothetical protein